EDDEDDFLLALVSGEVDRAAEPVDERRGEGAGGGSGVGRGVVFERNGAVRGGLGGVDPWHRDRGGAAADEPHRQNRDGGNGGAGHGSVEAEDFAAVRREEGGPYVP